MMPIYEDYEYEVSPEQVEDLEDVLVAVKPMENGDFWIKGRLSSVLSVFIPPGSGVVDFAQWADTPFYEALLDSE